jgi:hypothetical protein
MPWGEELRKPGNIIAIVIGAVGVIAGLLTGLYFYYQSEKAGQITMRVDQVQVFDKNRVGQLPLKIIDATGHLINENVFAANVAVWNSGNAEITKGAVRQPFRIVLEGNVVPLDLSVISYSSPYEGFHVGNCSPPSRAETSAMPADPAVGERVGWHGALEPSR